MACPHDGFHDIQTTYDRKRGVLLYFWTCHRCGAGLGEAGRREYRPSFDPHGNDRAGQLKSPAAPANGAPA